MITEAEIELSPEAQRDADFVFTLEDLVYGVVEAGSPPREVAAVLETMAEALKMADIIRRAMN